MFDINEIIVVALRHELERSYRSTFGPTSLHIPQVAVWLAERIAEHLSQTDALYHNLEHTALATAAGLEIMHGKQVVDGTVTPDEWLQFIAALLCHDIGYRRGICRDDTPTAQQTGCGLDTIRLGDHATDASLQPWHVDRGILFVREQLSTQPALDVDAIVRHIEYTRFPVPRAPAYQQTHTSEGLCRAADLIGQLGDPHYLRKLPALYAEMREVQTHIYESPQQMRDNYPLFFRRTVRPLIRDAERYLEATLHGRTWLARLHHNVRDAERGPDAAAAQPLDSQR